MAYLIQGVYFQHREELGFDGAGVVVRNLLRSAMYAGTLWFDPESAKIELTGQMNDHAGPSKLFKGFVSPEEVRFTKKYDHRPEDEINYVFRVRENGIWLGEYTGERCGTGVSSCIITEVLEQFFDPQFVTKRLGRSQVHAWPRKNEG